MKNTTKATCEIASAIWEFLHDAIKDDSMLREEEASKAHVECAENQVTLTIPRQGRFTITVTPDK